ncbi:DUF1697 domain-containing protein [Rugamonas sp.]|uniref:DUF1697 domain-containing protein n=1 Tax=Rugamonas sp. TaxID=1926287 RepID=UPI0025FC78C4|nr:DUF1697 domain-containing protein [Rugamonas sp.]
MTTLSQVALLRGINVGRAKRVAMADLRKLLTDLGYADVRTVLNSGNVVFRCERPAPADAATQIEEALVLKLGVGARVTVLDAGQFDDVVADNCLRHVASDPSRLLVAVFNNPADPRPPRTADPSGLDAGSVRAGPLGRLHLVRRRRAGQPRRRHGQTAGRRRHHAQLEHHQQAARAHRRTAGVSVSRSPGPRRNAGRTTRRSAHLRPPFAFAGRAR